MGTPFDYYVASTNENAQQASEGGKGKPNAIHNSLNLGNMLSDYSFGESSVAKMPKDSLLNIMEEFRATFEEQAQDSNMAKARDWGSAFQELEWQQSGGGTGDANNRFIGTDFGNDCPLHQVDRKFLYSFWHECFDNRQQLFLVFVRAEPMSASSGSMGKSMPSSQLGGRAVALVWRDPAVPSYSRGQQRKSRQELSGTGDSVREDVMDIREKCAPHRTRVLFYHQFD